MNLSHEIQKNKSAGGCLTGKYSQPGRAVLGVGHLPPAHALSPRLWPSRARRTSACIPFEANSCETAVDERWRCRRGGTDPFFPTGIRLPKCSALANLRHVGGEVRLASQSEGLLYQWPAGNGLPLKRVEMAWAVKHRYFFQSR